MEAVNEGERMRVLHINCNYLGTALHQTMVEHLDALGYVNKVFVPTYDRNLAVIRLNPNVVVSECFRKWDRIAFDYKQSKIIRAAQREMQVEWFDRIHAYTLFTDGNCAMHLSQKYGIPYVVAVRNTDVNTFFAKMIHLRGRGIKIMRNASAIFFLSEAYRRQVFDKYVPEKYHDELMEKTHIIPNGIHDFWLEHTVSDVKVSVDKSRQIKLIYAGRIDKNKNIPTTQKAMQLLREKGYDVSLTVVGKIEDEKEYEKIIEDKYTRYIPAKPKEELISVYRDHDIFVMPSFTETFGLVYAEAMSQGLPVVYSSGQGFDKQFPDGVVGFPAEANSVESVAEAIEKVILQYADISKNTVSGATRFNWHQIGLQYDQIYQRV